MKNQIFVNNEYLNNDSKIQFTIEYIKNTDFSKIEDGRLEFDNGIWANIQTYLTKKDALFEAHRKYIDVQYIISGEEFIGITDYSNCTTEIEYDTEKDIEFLTTKQIHNIEMYAGDYLILYPSDAHKPSITLKETTQVRKIVFKIPVDF